MWRWSDLRFWGFLQLSLSPKFYSFRFNFVMSALWSENFYCENLCISWFFSHAWHYFYSFLHIFLCWFTNFYMGFRILLGFALAIKDLEMLPFFEGKRIICSSCLSFSHYFINYYFIFWILLNWTIIFLPLFSYVT